MNLSVGIVGLPNVGKSTLFNALLKKSPFAKASGGQASGAKIANYPFTTIEPNIGVVEVPDERLPVLAKIVNTTQIVPAIIEFYDIAGLVKGASTGEGLGNKFLSHIREVAAIIHVVRFFEDGNIIHVDSKHDPLSDISTVETELILADLESLKKQKKPVPPDSKEEKATYEVVKLLISHLDLGKPARTVALNKEQKIAVKNLNLLTLKPQIFVVNVSENQLENFVKTQECIQTALKELNISASDYLYLNAKLENDILTFPISDQKEYLKHYNLDDTGLNRLIKKSYELLNLISFLTAGEKEVRAWTITNGTTAPQAAGVIHSDFEKHFIKADVISYADFVALKGWTKARDAGKVNIVGKEYIMKNGEVVEFKVGV